MSYHKYLVVFVVVFGVFLSTTTVNSTSSPAQSPSSGPSEDEQIETFTLDEPLGRTFITVNGSNIITTPNFVVGITLIGISLALLFGSAASAASVAAASTLAAGSYPPTAKYKRSIPESTSFNSAANILKTLASVEQQFKNFDVTDVECRKRIICEIHQVGANGNASVKRLGNFADVVLDSFNNLSSDSSLDKYPFVKQYIEAANHGKSQKECSQVYNTCEYSVKNVLRNLPF
ncbi:hypothetical protein CHUAL_012674 [Chamberlinius hualienensis]